MMSKQEKDEQRYEKYLQLIAELLQCDQGEEVEILEANQDLLDADLLTAMAQVADYLTEQGKENAANWLRSFAAKLQGEAETNPWQELNQQVLQLYQEGQYNAAVPLAEQALELAKQTWGDNHPDVATSLNNLAELYAASNRTQEAFSLNARSRSHR